MKPEEHEVSYLKINWPVILVVLVLGRHIGKGNSVMCFDPCMHISELIEQYVGRPIRCEPIYHFIGGFGCGC